MTEQDQIQHILDAHSNSKLAIKEEFQNESGRLDLGQLFDDLDQYTDDDSDIDAIRGMRHELERRIEIIGEQ